MLIVTGTPRVIGDGWALVSTVVAVDFVVSVPLHPRGDGDRNDLSPWYRVAL